MTIEGGSVSLEMRAENNILQYRINGGEWVDILDMSELGYATESWVESKGYQLASDVSSAISTA